MLDPDTDRWWMIRAEGGSHFERFSKDSIVAAGSETPRVDLSNVRNERDLRAKFEESTAGKDFLNTERYEEVRRFVLDIRLGDVVVTPSAGTTELLIRNVSSAYRFEPKDPGGLHLHLSVEPGRCVSVPIGERNRLPRQPKGTVFVLSPEQIALIRDLLGRSNRPS